MARRMITVKEIDFVDDTINNAEEQANNILTVDDVETEQTSRENQDTILQNAIGGLLRHQLVESANIDFEDTAFVDLGTLEWTKETNHFYSNTINNIKIPLNASTLPTLICSKYQKATATDIYNETTDKSIGITTNGRFYLYDSDATNPSELNNLINGVIVAYEIN